MGDTTDIEWADSSWNPWIGCTKISPACDNCYAEAMMDSRLGRVSWGAGEPRVRTGSANWKKPLRWNREAFASCSVCDYRGPAGAANNSGQPLCARCGQLVAPVRRRVFCASLGDVFDNEVDPAWRVDLLQLIADTPNLDWLLLTKRIGNAERMLDEALDVMSHGLTRWRDAPWPNVWLGITACDRHEMLRDAPKLRAIPARVSFWSYEPALGPLGKIPRDVMPDWIIAGGESGPQARPLHPAWVKSLRDQCLEEGVPFLFKQWGEFRHRAGVEDTRNDPKGSCIYVPEHSATYARVGKKKAGRTLDGITHNAFPVSA